MRQIGSLTKQMDAERFAAYLVTQGIHAHSEGQLDSFEKLGVEEVGVMAEWITAGDDRVCERCAVLEGAVLKVKEARGLIPRHPNCRCAWLPANVGEGVKGQKLTKGTLDAAFEESIRVERPGRPLRDAKALSTWPGKSKKISKKGRKKKTTKKKKSKR